jgi:hypothetical protein
MFECNSGVFFETVVLLTNFKFFELDFDFKSSFDLFIGFQIPIVFLLLLKTTEIKSKESRNLKLKMTRLKKNPKIFEVMLGE